MRPSTISTKPAARPSPSRRTSATKRRWKLRSSRSSKYFGRLDILVSNAGIFSAERDGKVDGLPKPVWDEIVGVNLTGMYLACKHGVAGSRPRPEGRGGDHRFADRHVGLHAGQRRLWVEQGRRARPVPRHGCRPRPEGIRVNVVVPGFTLTPIVRELVADPKVYEWQVQNIPLKRGAEPHEIAGAVAFLASDDASYMTGSFIFVDGGLTAI